MSLHENAQQAQQHNMRPEGLQRLMFYQSQQAILRQSRPQGGVQATQTHLQYPSQPATGSQAQQYGSGMATQAQSGPMPWTGHSVVNTAYHAYPPWFSQGLGSAPIVINQEVANPQGAYTQGDLFQQTFPLGNPQGDYAQGTFSQQTSILANLQGAYTQGNLSQQTFPLGNPQGGYPKGNFSQQTPPQEDFPLQPAPLSTDTPAVAPKQAHQQEPVGAFRDGANSQAMLSQGYDLQDKTFQQVFPDLPWPQQEDLPLGSPQWSTDTPAVAPTQAPQQEPMGASGPEANPQAMLSQDNPQDENLRLEVSYLDEKSADAFISRYWPESNEKQRSAFIWGEDKLPPVASTPEDGLRERDSQAPSMQPVSPLENLFGAPVSEEEIFQSPTPNPSLVQAPVPDAAVPNAAEQQPYYQTQDQPQPQAKQPSWTFQKKLAAFSLVPDPHPEPVAHSGAGRKKKNQRFWPPQDANGTVREKYRQLQLVDGRVDDANRKLQEKLNDPKREHFENILLRNMEKRQDLWVQCLRLQAGMTALELSLPEAQERARKAYVVWMAEVDNISERLRQLEREFPQAVDGLIPEMINVPKINLARLSNQGTAGKKARQGLQTMVNWMGTKHKAFIEAEAALEHAQQAMTSQDGQPGSSQSAQFVPINQEPVAMPNHTAAINAQQAEGEQELQAEQLVTDDGLPPMIEYPEAKKILDRWHEDHPVQSGEAAPLVDDEIAGLYAPTDEEIAEILKDYPSG